MPTEEDATVEAAADAETPAKEGAADKTEEGTKEPTAPSTEEGETEEGGAAVAGDTPTETAAVEVGTAQTEPTPKQEPNPQAAAVKEVKHEEPHAKPPVIPPYPPAAHHVPTPAFRPPPMYPPPVAAMPAPAQAVHTSLDTAKKRKRQYIIKNPNRPKRPLSAYNIFFKYERERLVREEMLKDENVDREKVEELIAIRDKTKTGKRVHRKTHGAIAFADLGKLISKNWKALSEEERSKYAAEASIDKERYQREVEESNAALALADEPPKPNNEQPGPRIRNKRLGDGPDAKRVKIPDGTTYPGYNEEYHGSAQAPRGPPPYYDPYFGYGQGGMGRGPPPHMPGGDGYGPPPPGYGGPPPPPIPYGYPYPPPPPEYYYGRPPPPQAFAPNTEGAAAKDTTPPAHAFAPPYPYPPYPGYPPRPPPMQPNNEEGRPNPPPPGGWGPSSPPTGEPAECAYQCEVCNNAVFATFKECADHEEECAKKHAKAAPEGESGAPPQAQEEVKPPLPSPNTQKKEETEKRAAVEAVLLLKTGNEAADV